MGDDQPPAILVLEFHVVGHQQCRIMMEACGNAVPYLADFVDYRITLIHHYLLLTVLRCVRMERQPARLVQESWSQVRSVRGDHSPTGGRTGDARRAPRRVAV